MAIYFLINQVLFFLGEKLLIHEAERQPPHKIDENLWKNREQIEEILFLLETSNWPTSVRDVGGFSSEFLVRPILSVYSP